MEARLSSTCQENLTHTHTHVCVWYWKERICKHVTTVRTICTLFYEQVVCGRGTKLKVAYLIRVAKIAIWLYCSLAMVRYIYVV